MTTKDYIRLSLVHIIPSTILTFVIKQLLVTYIF